MECNCQTLQIRNGREGRQSLASGVQLRQHWSLDLKLEDSMIRGRATAKPKPYTRL